MKMVNRPPKPLKQLYKSKPEKRTFIKQLERDILLGIGLFGLLLFVAGFLKC